MCVFSMGVCKCVCVCADFTLKVSFVIVKLALPSLPDDDVYCSLECMFLTLSHVLSLSER